MASQKPALPSSDVGANVQSCVKHKIQIELRDAEGELLPKEDFVLQTVDGKELIKGKLNEKANSGVIDLKESECRLIYPGRDNQTWVFGILGEVPPISEVLTPLEKPSAWIEIELRDADGELMAGQKFKIVLPNGTVVKEGVLKPDETVRIENIPAAECMIVFPDRDNQTWVFGVLGADAPN